MRVPETGQDNHVWTIEEDKLLLSIVSDQIKRSKSVRNAIAKDIPEKSKAQCHQRLEHFFDSKYNKTSGAELIDFAGMFDGFEMEGGLFDCIDFGDFESDFPDPFAKTGISTKQTRDLATLVAPPDSTSLLCNESLQIEELENESVASSRNTDKTWKTNVPSVVISIKNWTNVRNPFEHCNNVINGRKRKRGASQSSKLIVPGTMAFKSYCTH